MDADRPTRQRGRPLKQAIQECEARWFQETLQSARDGDANQMALLGHMLTVGYGCDPSQGDAGHWFEEASKRLGYHPLEAGQQLLGGAAGPPPPAAAAGGGGSYGSQQQQHQQQR
ncbi:MAG: hypothetical protein J3K34DRAFT_375566, partial [Monoraphidium minutum]